MPRATSRHFYVIASRCAREYAQIVGLGERLDPRVLDEEPLIHVYFEAAKAHLTEPNPQ